MRWGGWGRQIMQKINNKRTNKIRFFKAVSRSFDIIRVMGTLRIQTRLIHTIAVSQQYLYVQGPQCGYPTFSQSPLPQFCRIHSVQRSTHLTILFSSQPECCVSADVEYSPYVEYSPFLSLFIALALSLCLYPNSALSPPPPIAPHHHTHTNTAFVCMAELTKGLWEGYKESLFHHNTNT